MIDIGYWKEWKDGFRHRLKHRFPDVECYISANKRERKYNRFIQFSSSYPDAFLTTRGNNGIHYEYYDGKLYLHIEDSKLKSIANILRIKTRDNKDYKWERNGWGIVGHCLKNVFINNEEQLFQAQSEIPVHANLYKLLNLHHENLPCILAVPSRWA